MEYKINLHRLNIFIVLSFIGTFIIVLLVDLTGATQEKSMDLLVFWRLDQNIVHWHDDGPAKLTGAIISWFKSVIFFIIARKYNKIRQTKQDKTLSSMILYSLIYLGIARLFEAYFIISDSDLHGIVFSVGKYYVVLDLIGVLLFALVSMEVFLGTEFDEKSKFPSFLQVVIIISIGIALSSLFLEYMPNDIEKVTDWSVTIASIFLIAIIALVLIIVCTKILKIYFRFKEHENRDAILVIGIQLLLFILAVSILIYLEVGPADAADYFLRAGRCGMLAIIGWLYMLSFIKPSLTKKENIST